MLGSDHHGYVKRIYAAWAALGGDPGAYEIVIMQLVNLFEGGERAQMSKREGAIVTLDALLDDIGVDAARWYLASRSHDTSIDLDLELARSQSQDNPVYYVQYAHARIASILRKAGEERVAAALAADLRASEERFHPSARSLVKRLLEFPAEVREAADRRAPHRMTTYAHETAQEFSAFYRDCRVVGAAEEGGDEDVRHRDLRAGQGRARALARPARSRGARRRCRVGAVRLALLAAVAVSLACAAPAAAVDRYIPMKVPPAPGPAKYDRVWVQQLGPERRHAGGGARAGHAGRRRRDHAGGARHRAARPAHAGVDRRPPPAGVRGHLGVPRPRPRRGARLLPRLQVPRVLGEDAKFVSEWGLKVQLRRPAHAWSGARAPAAPQGDPRRPLGRRLDRGRLRGLGLRRPPGLPRDRRAGADRRRPARQLRRGERRARAARAGRHPQRQGVPRPARHRAPRDRRDLRPGRRALRLRAPRRTRRRCRTFPLLPPEFKPPFTVTNEALLGYAFDATTSPKALELIQVRAGGWPPAATRAPGRTAS